MRKTPGTFVGHRKFSVDRNWLRDQEKQRSQQRRQQFEEWSEKWITVTRLRQTRLWTDGTIKRWLGQPEQLGKYKVFSVDTVKKAENLKEFQEWRQPRLNKKRAHINNYHIPFL